MNKFQSPLALMLLTLAGCASPAQTGAMAPSTGQPAAPAARQFAAADAASPAAASVGNGLIVRFKPGHDRQSLERGSFLRDLRLARTHLFDAADPTERASILAQLRADPAVELAEPDYRMQEFAAPASAPDLSKQWAMTKIQAPQAWQVTHGDKSIEVAVVDTGVNYNHPDLAGQVIKGHNFVANTDDPMDDEGHGTHCAGVIAANGTAIAGVASQCQILAVKVLGSDGSGSTSTIADGIGYAVQHGAKVISLSLGGPQQSQVLQSAIQQAVSAGVVVVAAAGNDSAATPNYPAAFPGVISVGASDENDQKAFFSNDASSVAIAAPGMHIYSAFKDGYKSLDGTSMAAPHVAGVAALVRSQHPDWAIDRVRAALVESGDPVSGFTGNSGLRRLNAARALAWNGSTPAATPAAPATAPAGAPTGPAIAPRRPQPPVARQPQQPLPGYPGRPVGMPMPMPMPVGTGGRPQPVPRPLPIRPGA